MCRWLAYSGSPVLLEDLLFKPANSLVVQSMHSRLGVEAVNGDGFGVGWYGAGETPGVYHSTAPAWSDRNLRELSAHASAGRVFAHIRATTGTAVQQTNCHPFRHGRWLWMHNGVVNDFLLSKRDLALAVDPSLFPAIEGSTDSELFFYLALTFGLEQDPPGAVARAVGLIEEAGRRHGVQHPIQMTVATTDGETTWAFRYSSEGTVAIAVPQHRRGDAAPAAPRQPRAPPAVRRRPARGVRAVGRPAGSLAGGAGVHVPRRARRRRGAAPVLARRPRDRGSGPSVPRPQSRTDRGAGALQLVGTAGSR